MNRLLVPLSLALAGLLHAAETPATPAPTAPAVAPVAKTPASADKPSIGLGDKETDTHTHLRFEGVPKDAKIVKVSSRLIVDKAADKGLNFFAIQVNFPNKTWAHGGPQFNDGKNELANWGGLVNRGGGSKDYTEVDWKKDITLIECGIGKPNTVPFKWSRGVEYLMTVERGKKVVIPAGLNKQHNVEAPERTMWEWKFTIVPVAKGHDSFESLIYDSADHIGSFYLWNESGYGSKNEDQHTRWSLPRYVVEGGAEELTPTGWKRF